MPNNELLTRRKLLAVSAILPLAACTPGHRDGGTRPTRATSDAFFAALEHRHDARLGVWAQNVASQHAIDYRADERFAFCSTFKPLAAAAVLDRNPLSHLDHVVHFTANDVNSISPVTPRYLSTGMTLTQVCDAAIRYSDGTAGNLLLRELGGPARLTAYLRGLGDSVSRMDQYEPELNRDEPGDPRDTTTPRAIAGVYRSLVLGSALTPDKSSILTDWLQRNTTGDQRIRAGIPIGWRVADKTGTGDYGRANDVAIAWTPAGAPIVMALLSDRHGHDAEPRNALLAEAAGFLATSLADV